MKTGEDRIPGDREPEALVHSVIRVNHAGEYGAKRIYEGQLAVLKGKKVTEVIRHMAEQEQGHLDAFTDMVQKRQVRPTLLMPLWHVAGFALGAGTALLGEKAAMACTVAVEEVIDEHYAGQLDLLGEDEKDLKENIVQFRQEELEHRDIGLEHDAEDAPAYPVLSSMVKTASRIAIALSKRI